MKTLNCGLPCSYWVGKESRVRKKSTVLAAVLFFCGYMDSGGKRNLLAGKHDSARKAAIRILA